MTDGELKRAVEDALHHEVRLRGRRIAVEVRDGEIMLQGEVESVAEKRLAVNLVRRMRVAGSVRDGLRLPTVHDFTAAQICQHVQDGLEQDTAVHHQAIQVSCREGVVKLTGELDSLEEKRLVGLIAWWVPGVADVDNQIVLNPPQADSEDSLIDSVRQALEKDILVNPDLIGVTVRGNHVTLLGSVGSDEERMAAEHDVYYLWGVELVDNQLTVTPR